MRKFLIVNPFGIGDAIFSLASAQRIREVYPDAFLGFVGNERTEEFLKLCPALNRVYVFNRDQIRATIKKSPSAFFQTIKEIKRLISDEKYDTLIDFSLGREFSAAALMLGMRNRVGFDYKGRGIFLTQKKKMKAYSKVPVAQEQLNLLWEKKVLPDNSMPSEIKINVEGVAAEFFLEPEKKILVVAPGGGRSWGEEAIYKQWEPEKFASVVNSVLAVSPGIQVALLGDHAENPLFMSLIARLNEAPVLVMSGEPIRKVCALLKKADVLLCNDGGLLHLANALGTKTVSIFGPVDEKVYGPYGGSALKKVVTHAVPCRPCYQNFHFPGCAFDRRCLRDLSVHKVIEAVQEIL